eukprot:2981205-Rhodomonas_salina.1
MCVFSGLVRRKIEHDPERSRNDTLAFVVVRAGSRTRRRSRERRRQSRCQAHAGGARRLSAPPSLSLSLVWLSLSLVSG